MTLRRQLYRYIIGMGEPHQIDLRLDGVRVQRFTIGGEGRGMTAPASFAGNTQGDPQWEVYMHAADEGLQLRVPVTAGTHEIGVSFVQRFWEPEGILQPPQRGFARTTNELYHGPPAIDTVAVAGPLAPRADRPRHVAQNERLFVCRPSQPPAERECARRILGRVATARLPSSRQRGGARHGAAVLRHRTRGRRVRQRHPARARAGARGAVVPVPGGPRAGGPAPGAVFPLSDLELASRLSFFLWSSVPDDALRLDASRGRLREPGVLQAHVRRMLADPRSRALVDSFALQWLKVGKVAGVVPDVDAFPEFDENLRRAMLEETGCSSPTSSRSDRPCPSW